MKGAGATIIDDVVKADFATFPRDDPADLQRKAKLMVEEDKLRKEMERERKAAEKAEAVAVKKAVATKPAAAAAKEAPAAANASKDNLNRVKVRLYYQHCSHKLQSKEPKNLHSIGGLELQELLSAIEAELQSHGGIEMAASGLIGISQVAEMLNAQFNPLGLALSGPAASFANTIVSNRKAWDDLLTEFAICHAEWFLVGPGKRLVGFMVQTAMTVDSANKAAIAELYARQRVVPPKEKEEVEQL